MQFLTQIDYTAGPDLAAGLKSALKTHKVVHLRKVPGDLDLDAFYQDLGRSLGEFLFKNENPVTAALDVDGWVDMRFDRGLADANPYRHGNGRMPLHIDGVYTDVHFDILFFFCTSMAKWGGATTIIDGETVVAFLEDYDPKLLADLRATPVRFTKGSKSKLSPIIFEQDGLPAFNWNVPRIDERNSDRVKDMCRRFDAFCEQRLVDGGIVTDCRLAVGEALFFHNRLTLHGRNSFWGDRCLLKGAVATRRPSTPTPSEHVREPTLDMAIL